MSTDRMTPHERELRAFARAFGRETAYYIELAAPWNRAGDKCIEQAYDAARRAARSAALSLDVRERRTRRRRSQKGQEFGQ
jgi:hypothetical protein